VLQQQLKSFWTFQQKTLENINRVQSKIQEMLTKNLFERKTPVHSSGEIQMTGTPSSTSLDCNVLPFFPHAGFWQERVRDLPNENLSLQNKVEPLTVTNLPLKENVLTCNTQMKDFAEEKTSVPIHLVKSQEGNKEHIEEAKNTFSNWKELQTQKNILEQERRQLHNGKQHSIQTQPDSQMMNQKAEEKVTAVSCEGEMQILEAKKLNLEMTPQQCSYTKEMLQKDFEKIPSDKAYPENKLESELRNTKASIDLLKSNLTNANMECKRLSTAVTNMTEENELLKKELREVFSKHESDLRQLTDKHFLLENHVCTIEK
ncbi:PREDICTED: coiled-coil domain-containing protein 110, partial [Leptosomus discolor]|uniref:coiled-coil domain-containing protein 110 n=1 Tax=Leptosomus discolor TaxID=188344 RepID=UPI000522CC2F